MTRVALYLLCQLPSDKGCFIPPSHKVLTFGEISLDYLDKLIRSHIFLGEGVNAGGVKEMERAVKADRAETAS